MESDTLNCKNDYINKALNHQKIYKFLIIIFIIFCLIIFSVFISIFNLKTSLNEFKQYFKDIKYFLQNNIFKLLNNNIENTDFNKDDYILKSKYLDEIQFYKEILRLYAENKTEFRIRGRKRIMEICGKIYNESNIITIQDKLNWLLIHENPEYKTSIVDKILLHEYSKKILGKDICVPILKIYNSTEEIKLDELPEKFVLKCNHGCGMNILCNNKSTLNLLFAKNKLDNWQKLNYGLRNFEYQYINIKRKIYAEKYLLDNINDYKIYCFNGDPKFIRVQKKLKDEGVKVNNYYNLNWTLNEIETGLGNHFVRRPDMIFEKPKKLDLMIEYAKKLSSEFTFVRVDFYEVDEEIFLGEMTFSPSNIIFNCKDRNQSIYLGELLDISKVKY